jgi:hypothetical protein
MNANSTWKQNQSVSGLYCGQTYQGKINNNTRPTPDYRNVIFSITLDAPITVFGATRETIEVWTNSEHNTIN